MNKNKSFIAAIAGKRVFVKVMCIPISVIYSPDIQSALPSAK